MRTYIDGIVDRFVDYGRRGIIFRSGKLFEKFPGKAIEQANEVGTLVALPLVGFRKAVASTMLDPTLFRNRWSVLASEELWSIHDPENPLQSFLLFSKDLNYREGENEFNLLTRGMTAALRV